jgi:hypothetical protein
MNDVHKMEQEKNVLRWGGLAGILGSILFVAGWVIVGVGPVGMEDPTDLAGWVTRFPDIQAARVVENLVYLAALLLAVPLYLALYRALRKTRLAPALFGSALGILGLVSMAVGATPHVAHAPLSALYHAPGTTPADQAAIALMWQATRGIFDALLYVGFFVVPIGLLLLGVGMLGTPAFGKLLGWVGVGLGVVGLVGAVLQMADPASMVGAVSYFAIVIFYLVMGIKVYRLSRTL